MSDDTETKPTVVKKAPLPLVMGDTVGELPKYPEGLSIWPDSYKIQLPKEKIHKLSDISKENTNE